MRNPLRRALSTALAVAILGYAVMLSASLAKGPQRSGSAENAIDCPPLGLPDKALISDACDPPRDPQLRATVDATSAGDPPAFDWGLESRQLCPKCRKAAPAVVPVVLDVPEVLGGGDATAIDVIKRKTGINVFRGSIFDGPDAPAVKLLKQEEPAELQVFDQVLGKIGYFPQPLFGACEAAGEFRWAGFSVGRPAPTTWNEACDAENNCRVEGKEIGRAVSATRNESCVAEDNCPGAQENANSNVGVARASFQRALRDGACLEDPVLALRCAGLELDEIAEHLELQDRYAEADAIREAAQQLRVKARALKGGAPAMTLSDAPPFRKAPAIIESATSGYWGAYASTEESCSDTCSADKCTCKGNCTAKDCPAKKASPAQQQCSGDDCPSPKQLEEDRQVFQFLRGLSR